jgi:hypothetical protein
MAHLTFKHEDESYRAEVTLGPDLELDEILEVERVAKSGALYAITDWAELEEQIEAELSCRTEDLRKTRERLRKTRPARLPFRYEEPTVEQPRKASQRASQKVAPEDAQKSVDTDTSPVVECIQVRGVVIPAAPSSQLVQEVHMTQFNRISIGAKGQSIYKMEGGIVRLRFTPTAFAGGAPETIQVDAPFAVKVPKAKLTKEERAALPKKTKAERLAELQARIAKLQAQLEL